jgi:hypothetical protein
MNIKFQDISLEVIPDQKHEWLLDSVSAAQGYGISASSLRSAKSRNEDEFIEGVHYVLQNATVKNSLKTKIFWTKLGVINLGFFIKSDKAKSFRQWASVLVLKVLNASPVDKLKNLDAHTKREVQVTNSKDVNGYNCRNFGVEMTIDYNRANCRMVSGYSPSELKEIGKKQGLKSNQRTSGKEVLRHMRPALAAQMSLNDDLVQQGVKLTEANALSAPCVPMLQKLIELKKLTV